MAITISKIIDCSYQAAYNEMRRVPHTQKIQDWVSPVLNKASAEGRIQIKPLGVCVETPDGQEWEVKQLQVPCTWSKGDESKNDTEFKKISLARALIENGINSAEDLLEEQLSKFQYLVVSKQYRNEKGGIYSLYYTKALDTGEQVLSPTINTAQSPDAWYFHIYTAFAGIYPKSEPSSQDPMLQALLERTG